MAPTFLYRVVGIEYHPRSTETRDYSASGMVEADSVPDAFLQLLQRGDFWDMLDIDAPLTIEVAPVEDEQ